MSDVCMVFCTCPDADAAAKLAGALLERRLAACVNVIPQIRSMYRWQGAVASDDETLMLIKTTKDAYSELESWLKENHPYEVPEVLAVPVRDGSADYLAWVAEETES